MTSKLRDQKGVTLIEILIAMVIFSISLFTILEFVRGTQASLTSVSRQLTYDVIKMNVGNVLSSEADCKKAIKNAGSKFIYTGSETRLPQIEVDGDPLVQENVLVDGIVVKDIIVRPVAGVPVTQSAYYKYHLAELVINAEKQGEVMGYRTLSNENNPFRFYIVTNQNNEMESCSASGLMEVLKACSNRNLNKVGDKVENGETYEIYDLGKTKGFEFGRAPGEEKKRSPTAESVCGVVAEKRSLTLECPKGKLVSRVVFASYGSGVTGKCEQFTAGACNAKSSVDAVTAACYGRLGCTIFASNSVFSGDPCPGTAKSLTVELECEQADKVPIPEGYDITDPNIPIPPPEPTPKPTGIAIRCVTKAGEELGTVAICVADKPCYWE